MRKRFRTVLEQKIWERRQTFEEFAEFAEVFARENREPGTIGARHLQRLAAGRRASGEPLGPVRPATARLLERILGADIDELLSEPAHSEPADQGGGQVAATADGRAQLADALAWQDGYAGWKAGTAWAEVGARLAELRGRRLLDRRARRARVGRAEVVRALLDYYGPHDAYRARVDDRSILTSIVTRPDWLDLSVPLSPASGRMTLDHPEPLRTAIPDEVVTAAAVERLAESAVFGVRVTDRPLYRLLSVAVGSGTLAGSVGLMSFAEYALTADLLEGELIDALTGPGRDLPLRDRFLPDRAAVLDLPGRSCAGGALALCAIARPADRFRDAPDYALLVQERSASVVNGTGTLSVIPKGFHQPMTDVSADAAIGATLYRELEEELFGRPDIDSTAGGQRAADPMHPSRLSEPLRWLTTEPGRLRVECTGFGFNLVSGNYEFAGLVVIEDEEFWPKFGGQVVANWEASGLRLYSSRDPHLLARLAVQENWSNEGLFAFLQGVRRLREVGGGRVDLPVVESAL